MKTMTSCATCGAPLPPGRAEPLCPRCVMGAALRASSPDESQDVAPLPAGSRVGPYEILETLGQGGMGVVYRARHTSLERTVAVKVLAPALAKDPEFVGRFRREAKALATLSHPHIVTVYDFGTDGSQAYIAMEFVEGVNLRTLLAERQVTPKEALRIVPQICDALEYAHAQGVVHRDIKPENILVSKQGQIKIADFGLAKMAEKGEGTLTRTSVTMGTPQYMAPEQYERMKDVDHRADIYSLGVVLYEMLTGEVPAGHFQLPSQKVEVDVRLDEIVLKALAKEPERRYQRAAEVKTDVETVIASGPEARAPEAAFGERSVLPDPPKARAVALLTGILWAFGFGAINPAVSLFILNEPIAHTYPRGLVSGALAGVIFGSLMARRLRGATFSIRLRKKSDLHAIISQTLSQMGYSQATTFARFWAYRPSFRAGLLSGDIAVQLLEHEAVVGGPWIVLKRLRDRLLAAGEDVGDLENAAPRRDGAAGWTRLYEWGKWTGVALLILTIGLFVAARETSNARFYRLTVAMGAGALGSTFLTSWAMLKLRNRGRRFHMLTWTFRAGTACLSAAFVWISLSACLSVRSTPVQEATLVCLEDLALKLEDLPAGARFHGEPGIGADEGLHPNPVLTRDAGEIAEMVKKMKVQLRRSLDFDPAKIGGLWAAYLKPDDIAVWIFESNEKDQAANLAFALEGAVRASRESKDRMFWRRGSILAYVQQRSTLGGETFREIVKQLARKLGAAMEPRVAVNWGSLRPCAAVVADFTGALTPLRLDQILPLMEPEAAAREQRAPGEWYRHLSRQEIVFRPVCRSVEMLNDEECRSEIHIDCEAKGEHDKKRVILQLKKIGGDWRIAAIDLAEDDGAAPQDPQQLLERMLVTLSRAKTIHVRFSRPDFGEINFLGEMYLATENRLRMSVLNLKREEDLLVISDGRTLFELEGDFKDAKSSPVPHDLNERFVKVLGWIGFDGAGESKGKGDLVIEFKEPRYVGLETIGSHEAHRIEYWAEYRQGSVKGKIEIWIDALTNLPIQRRCTMSAMDGHLGWKSAESYTDWSLDAEVDPELFKLPAK
ncbi:MAG: protein kinase [Planctomycetes bacterium]|nr:protein kinase [Planctomycetota bacterium]